VNQRPHRPHRRGSIGIPRHLQKKLPWWLRYGNGLFINPLCLAAIPAWALGHTAIGTALLLGSIALHLGSFWAARAVLRANGYWKPGTWYAEVMPSIQAARAVTLGLLVVAIGCSYLVLGAEIRNDALIVVAISALALLVPAYAWTSLVQGYVGGDSFNVDYREEHPGKFWGGLFFYASLIALFVAIVIFFLLNPLQPAVAG
jgi:hypothetical protein